MLGRGAQAIGAVGGDAQLMTVGAESDARLQIPNVSEDPVEAPGDALDCRTMIARDRASVSCTILRGLK